MIGGSLGSHCRVVVGGGSSLGTDRADHQPPKDRCSIGCYICYLAPVTNLLRESSSTLRRMSLSLSNLSTFKWSPSFSNLFLSLPRTLPHFFRLPSSWELDSWVQIVFSFSLWWMVDSLLERFQNQIVFPPISQFELLRSLDDQFARPAPFMFIVRWAKLQSYLILEIIARALVKLEK